MNHKRKVTVVVENTAGENGIIPEHGICFWIETGDSYVIFDTGQGGVLLNNASVMGIPLEKVGHIVLSHGHYDHTGGLRAVLPVSSNPKLYAHPSAFQPKFACNLYGQSNFIGMPYTCREAVQGFVSEVIYTERPAQITEGIFVTGEIPRVTEFEDTGGPFFLDDGCTAPDPFPDDQALFFETSRGTVVLVGCAHAGVINTLLYIKQLTGDKPIHAVLGGMHLLSASRVRMEHTIEFLNRLDPDILCPGHCTGNGAMAKLREAFPRKFIPCNAGRSFEFG
ncbi:MAG TPA: MBL fold metallo-hydrolase [Desulfobacteraceae bacterium]|nr:MBL fold metallo-hydrolase [Desulfobacteraceae bacterium]HPJ66754.1 MBL fold metallo-hydrolase [Desulfobacteraceae bacterium]